MSRTLDRHVTGALSHRTGYGPAGGMMEFRYQFSGEMTLIRPDDGRPADVVRTRCPACGKALAYRVYSLRATRRRHAWWYALAAFALAVFIVTVVLATRLSDDVDDDYVLVLVLSMVGAFIAGVTLVQIAWGELGVRGHLTGWPIMAKHGFMFAAERPVIHCERCGHREVVEEDGYDGYQAAKARLGQHTCI